MKDKFSSRFKNIPQDIWLKIAELESLRGRWDGSTKHSPQVMGRLKKSVLITSTGASTRIEGSKLSDEDIEKMIRGISIKKFTNRDEQEVRGYYELLENVFNSWESLSFSEGLIKHLHKELLKYVIKDELHRGEYKKSENVVEMINEQGESVGVLFATTKAYLTSKEMLELLEWTTEELQNKKYHSVLVIANFVVEFLNIHPFTDGNGRLSRILTNLLMLKQGFLYMPYISHEKLIEDNKPDYYLSLRQTQKTLRTKNPDLSSWLNFFLDISLAQSRQALSLLTVDDVFASLSPTQQKVWEYLNTVDSASPMEIASKLNIPRPTINQVTTKLIDLKLIRRVGQGATTRYQKT